MDRNIFYFRHFIFSREHMNYFWLEYNERISIFFAFSKNSKKKYKLLSVYDVYFVNTSTTPVFSFMFFVVIKGILRLDNTNLQSNVRFYTE